MPEYLAPGVYVEETSFRAKTIEGVSTSTAGFLGPARFGPVRGEPELLTSFADFERIYGGLDPLQFGTGPAVHNYLAHAVRAFFEEGGRRLYVCRVHEGATPASASIGTPSFGTLGLRARHPGRGGNLRVRFQARVSENVLDTTGDAAILRGAREFDTVKQMRDTIGQLGPAGGSVIEHRLGNLLFELHLWVQ